jgi:hypothetical protein
MSKTLLAFAVVMGLALGMTACEKKKPSEKTSDAGKSAGQAVNDAAKATGNAVGDAATATGMAVVDAAKATGTAVGDAAKATSTAVVDAAKSTGTAVGDATKATGEYLSQSKDTAVEAAQDTLNGIEKKWKDLQAKAAPTTDEAKADLQKAKDLMVQTLADAKAKLVEAKDAGVDTWHQDVKPALDAALHKAQKLYEDTAARFGSKQAE